MSSLRTALVFYALLPVFGWLERRAEPSEKRIVKYVGTLLGHGINALSYRGVGK